MKNSVNMWTLFREFKSKDASLGQLYLNGEFICYILEDEVRQIPLKIPGETAIWGNFIYRMELVNSPAFGLVPSIEGIPLFDLVRIHAGNKEADTAGCPLPGLKWDTTPGAFKVTQSKSALQIVVDLFKSTDKDNFLMIADNLGEGVS